MLNDRKNNRLNINQQQQKQKCGMQQSNDVQYKRKKLNSASFGYENMKMNSKSGFNNKNSSKLLQKANRALKEKREMKIKIINAVIKRNLYKLQLEGLVERLDKMKLRTLETIENNKDNQAKVYARKEKLMIRQNESQQSIDALMNEKQKIEAMNTHKETQIKAEETELIALKQRELYINQVKHTIDSEIYILNNKVSKSQSNYSNVYEELQQMKRKKNKHNSTRLEILTNIFILKPVNKKICLLHNYHNSNNEISNNNNSLASVTRRRKSFSIKYSNTNQVMTYSFDYTISSIDQIYEEPLISSNEREYIWNEVFNIVNGYFKETNFVFILFLTHSHHNIINRDLIKMSQALIKSSNYHISIKGLMNQSLFNIANDISNEENLDQTMKNFSSNQGLVYSINSNDTKPKLIISSFGIESEETGTVLWILNEMNNKKKKEKSKLKLTLANHFLFNELNDINIPFHSLTILDASVFSFNDNDVVDFMFKLTQ